jgi:ketosteroid isomerase-like protein
MAPSRCVGFGGTTQSYRGGTDEVPSTCRHDCGAHTDSDDAADDPAAVVADYLEVFNAEDGDAVIGFYAKDAVIEGHPEESSDGLATSTSEILGIETAMNIHQGSTGTMEFINMEVSGDTVTFDNIFINEDGDCFSSTGSVMTVEDDKIALYVWGDLDAGLC